MTYSLALLRTEILNTKNAVKLISEITNK